jgi:hypothetical protein
MPNLSQIFEQIDQWIMCTFPPASLSEQQLDRALSVLNVGTLKAVAFGRSKIGNVGNIYAGFLPSGKLT